MGIFDLFKKKEYGEHLREQSPVQPEIPVTSISSGNDFLFNIEDVFYIKNRGVVVTGKVLSGSITLNEAVIIKENGIQSQVTGIEIFRKKLSVANAGDSVGIELHGISKKDVSKGYTLIK